MKPNITIAIPAPYVTIKEYAKRTGLSESAVRDLIKQEKLPVFEKNEKGKRGTIFINLAAITLDALSKEDNSL